MSKLFVIEELEKENPLKLYFDKINRQYIYLEKYDVLKYGIESIVEKCKSADIVSASLSTVNKFKKHSKIPLLYDSELFQCHHYYSYFGKYLLNSDYIILPVWDIKRRKDWLYKTFGVDNTIFFRPSAGDKPYSGGICKLEHFDYDLDYYWFEIHF